MARIFLLPLLLVAFWPDPGSPAPTPIPRSFQTYRLPPMGVHSRAYSDNFKKFLTYTENNATHFRHLGTMIGSISYAHLQFDVDLADLRNEINGLCFLQRSLLELPNPVPDNKAFKDSVNHRAAYAYLMDKDCIDTRNSLTDLVELLLNTSPRNDPLLASFIASTNTTNSRLFDNLELYDTLEFHRWHFKKHPFWANHSQERHPLPKLRSDVLSSYNHKHFKREAEVRPKLSASSPFSREVFGYHQPYRNYTPLHEHRTAAQVMGQTLNDLLLQYRSHLVWLPSSRTTPAKHTFHYNLTHSQELDFKQQLHDIIAPHTRVANDTESDFYPDREKRQALALAVGLGIGAVSSLLFSQSQMAKLADHSASQKFVLQTLRRHEADLKLSQIELHHIRHMLRFQKYLLADWYQVTRHYQTTDIVVSFLKRRVDRILAGLKSIHTHSLSTDLLRPIQLRRPLRQLRLKAKNQGITLAIDNIQDLFTLQTSHVLFNNMTLRVFVHIPAFSQTGLLRVYEFLPFPLTLPTHSNFILPRPKKTILAVDHTRQLYRTISDSEYAACAATLDTKACPTTSVFHKRSGSSCLLALFNIESEGIVENCDVEISPTQDYAVQLTARSFLLFHAAAATIEIQCPGHPITKVYFRGSRTLFLPTGCSASTKHFIFEGSDDVFNDPYFVTEQHINVSAIIHPALLTRLSNFSVFEENSLSLSKFPGGVKVKDIERHIKAIDNTRFTFKFVFFWIPLVMLVIATALGFLYLWKCTTLGNSLSKKLKRKRDAQKGPKPHSTQESPREDDQNSVASPGQGEIEPSREDPDQIIAEQAEIYQTPQPNLT